MKKLYILLFTLLITGTAFSQVFITELADPNNHDCARYIELYNAGGTPVDLSTWRIDKYTNASATVSQTLALTGTIAAGGFYIIATGPEDTELFTIFGVTPDQWDTAANNVAGSDGDDNLELYDGANTLIDQFGVPGEDGTGTCHEFEDGRVERKASVTAGNPTWDEAEWNVWAESTVSGCTSHVGTAQDAPGIFDPGAWIGTAINALVLSGIFDGPLSGGTPKGVELYVLADIPNLSLFGIGSANNGEGTDGQEFTFPAASVSAGTFIYVSSEATQFSAFFGFAPNYTDGAMGINGDDAVELFENGLVIDTYGVINVNGDGEVWDYTDGWAYRLNNTSPDGTTFVPANWDYSGINQLEGGATNAACTSPFPEGSYPSFLSVNEIDSNSFSVYPNPTNTGFINISSKSSEVINVKVFDILGKRVLESKVKNNQLNVSNLNAGMYILKLSQNNAPISKKLVVQ